MKKQISRIAALFCASALSLSLVACGSKSSSESTTLSLGKADDYDYANFSYSQNIGTDGYWEDVHALDYVTLPEDYASVTIQKADVEPSNDDVQEQLDAVLVMDSSTAQVLDRAAVSGDNVNIDYVGSIDGVEFTGGSYSGYTLTLGSGSFIDGFEDQIVGHTPGETFDVTVTFPDGYSDSTDSEGNTIVLANQEAIFVVTLNYIEETVLPDLTDEWVDGYLGESDDIHTVQELTDYLYNALYTQNLSTAIFNYLMENSTFNGCPDVVLNYQVCECLSYYYTSAQLYGMTLDDLLSTYIGYDSADDMLDYYADTIYEYCNESLLYQAVAESLGIVATDEMYEPYTDYVDSYGEGYLRMYVLVDAVMDALCDSAQVV